MQLRSILFSKHTITFLLLFTGIALALDTFFSRYIIMQAGISNEAKVHRLITNQNSEEIPVFGSSKARSAFIPDSLGPNVYNYGMEKCGFDVINFLLSIELTKDKTTPILIEFNHRSFISAPEHTINIATYVPNLGHQEVRDFLDRNDRLDTRLFIPGLRYFGSYFYYLRYYFKKTSGSRKVVSRGGNFSDFVLSKGVFNTLVENRLQMMERRKTLQRAVANEQQAISAAGRNELKSLERYFDFTADSSLVANFKQLAMKHPQREIILIYTPQHWSERQGITNLNALQHFYRSLESALPNVRVLDLSELPVPDSGFKNTSHLNLEGARQFSSALGKAL